MFFIGGFGLQFLFFKHRYNLFGTNVLQNLEAFFGITNLVKFKIFLIHKIFWVGDYIVLDVVDMISGPFPPGIKMKDSGVISYNILR